MAKMVSRILEQEEAIQVVLSFDRKACHLIPSWQDIDVLQSIDRALAPISSFTDILSADSYVTISAILPVLHLVNNKFLKEAEDDTTSTTEIKKSIKDDLNHRYSAEHLGEEIKTVLQMATFIDPRFKTKYMNTEESTDVKEKLIDEVSSTTMEAQLAEETNQSNTDSLPPPKKKKKTLGTLFKDNEQEDEQMPVISVQQCIMSELQTYSTTSKIDFEEDPLKWWKFHSAEYPCLSKLAKKYLRVCAIGVHRPNAYSVHLET